MSHTVSLTGAGLEAEPEPPRRLPPVVSVSIAAVVVVLLALGLAQAVNAFVGVPGESPTPTPAREHSFSVTSEGWTQPQGPTLHRRCAAARAVTGGRSAPCRGR